MPFVQRDTYGHIVARFANRQSGQAEEWLDDNAPELAPDTAQMTAELCRYIDVAADRARHTVAGDPLRALEYDRAATEAKSFAAAGYPADDVPRTVAAWAINGRTAQQAADSILVEAAAYTEALYRIREARLYAKQAVSAAAASGDFAMAEQTASDAVAAIARAAKGIGNNVL